MHILATMYGDGIAKRRKCSSIYTAARSIPARPKGLRHRANAAKSYAYAIQRQKEEHVANSVPAAQTRIRKYSLKFAQPLEMALNFLLAQPRTDTQYFEGVVDLVVHLGARDLPAEVRKGGPADDDK